MAEKYKTVCETLNDHVYAKKMHYTCNAKICLYEVDACVRRLNRWYLWHRCWFYDTPPSELLPASFFLPSDVAHVRGEFPASCTFGPSFIQADIARGGEVGEEIFDDALVEMDTEVVQEDDDATASLVSEECEIGRQQVISPIQSQVILITTTMVNQ